MKCMIIYLSVTGNTERIARTIRKGIIKAAGNCDIASLKETNWRDLWKYDLIGFGCPPMAGHIESPGFQTFIKNMRFVGGKHAFVFATHGTHPEFIFPSMVPRLIERGFTVIGMHDSHAPCYLSIMPWPYLTAGHPDETDLKAAEDFGVEMVERSRRISAGETDLIPPVPEPPKMDPQQEKQMAEMEEKEKKEGKKPYHSSFQELLQYHPDKCNYPKCRLCMDNCPEDGIDFSVDPPVICNPCIGCTFCAKICPTGAMDESKWVEASAPMLEMMMQSFYVEGMNKSESEGNFRKLIPDDQIGFKTPVYKTFTKHPQWIIGKGFNK